MSTNAKLAILAIIVCLTAGALYYYQNNVALRHISIITTQGKEIPFKVEVADTPKEKEQGLMFREHLPEDQGMLFIFDKPQKMAFWMKNTKISLDIIFFSADGRIRNIYKKAIPMDETHLPSNGQAKYVLEINGGLSDKLGIRTGDILKF